MPFSGTHGFLLQVFEQATGELSPLSFGPKDAILTAGVLDSELTAGLSSLKAQLFGFLVSFLCSCRHDVISYTL